MDLVDEFCDLLQSHANRDKVANLTCYALKLCGSTWKKDTLMTASARIAGTRATMRLFDDSAALRNILKYGLGRQDGVVWGTLGVANGLFTLAYLQAEKLCWLIDTKLLVVSKDTEFRLRTAHKLFWSLYSFVGFIRSLRALDVTAQELKSPQRRKCAHARFVQACLLSTKLLLDTTHAVSWLPPGWLWGGALSTQRASAIATAAATFGLVLHFHGKRLESKG